MLKQAVDWLHSNRRFFDPDQAPEQDRMFAKKALVELSLAIAYRQRLDPTPLSGQWLALLDLVESVARRPEYFQAAARDTRSLLLYGLTYAALRLCGREHREFRWVIERCLDTGYVAASERLPYRRMDLLHFLMIGGFDGSAGHQLDEAFRQTLLAQSPNIADLTDSDVYALTHAAFYVTDFGLRPSVANADVPEILESLLRIYVEKGDADIAGELLCCLLAFGRPGTPEAWSMLESMQRADGRVPGPDGIVKPRPDDAPGYFDWKQSYHTTIVCIVAAYMRQASLMVPTLMPVRSRTPRVESGFASSWVRENVRAVQVGSIGAELVLSADGGADLCEAMLVGLEPESLPFEPRTYASAVRLAEAGKIPASTPRRYPVFRAKEPLTAGEINSIAAGDQTRIEWADDAVREQTAIALSGEVRRAMRAYHLHDAAAALRALATLSGPQDRLVRDGMAWLLTQQRADGSFGYLTEESLDVRFAFTQSAALLLTEVRLSA